MPEKLKHLCKFPNMPGEYLLTIKQAKYFESTSFILCAMENKNFSKNTAESYSKQANYCFIFTKKNPHFSINERLKGSNKYKYKESMSDHRFDAVYFNHVSYKKLNDRLTKKIREDIKDLWQTAVKNRRKAKKFVLWYIYMVDHAANELRDLNKLKGPT